MKYVVFDCETTGLSPLSGDRICEIGAVKLEGNKIVDQYWHLVNPQREISYEAYMVNKIVPSMIKDAPIIDEILPSFLEFISGSKLAAYNAGFDISFLNAELKACEFNPVELKDAIDIYMLAKKMLPNLNKYPLWNVARSLDISVVTTHRALADAQLAAEVFVKLIGLGAGILINSVYLDYRERIKFIENAILNRQLIKIKFADDNGDILERGIMPCRIMEINGEEILEFEAQEAPTSIPIKFIEEAAA